MNIHSLMKNKDATKQQALMEASLSLLHEKGLSAFTKLLVAKRAGIATGTVYLYFESKEKRLDDSYQWVKKAGLDALIGQLDHSQPYPALMKELWIRFLRCCLEKEPEWYLWSNSNIRLIYT
ncbi:MAG: TetR/AcrR family transcriptional regulator [Microscillaceae bacterium]|nr:TetR/AcrR family transcriptional regulator [Microscillaceae bacterium]